MSHILDRGGREARRSEGCDFCLLELYRNAAKKEGFIVTVLDSVRIPGAFEVFAHPPTVDINKPGMDRVYYFKTRITTRGEKCTCRRRRK